MKRSSRSTPTGPGSRGGRFHEPEYRMAWFRLYRKTHPEYAERERERARERRRKETEARHERLAAISRSFTDDLAAMVRDECDRLSIRGVARQMAVDPATLRRLLAHPETGDGVTTETLDAVVAYFGLWRLAREIGRRHSARARNARDDIPTNMESVAPGDPSGNVSASSLSAA